MSNVSIHLKAFKDADSPFIHFWIIDDEECKYHSKKKMVVIPPIKHEQLWKDLSEFLSTTTEYMFEPARQTDQGLIVKIVSDGTESILFIGDLVVKAQKFFDEKYPAYNSM